MGALRIFFGMLFAFIGALLLFLVIFVPLAFLAFLIFGLVLLGIGIAILLNKGEEIIEQIKWK